MSLVDLGVVAVIVCNALFLALCTYMAWRMLTHMRDSQADLSAYANSLKAHAGRMNRSAEDALGVFGDVKRELGKLIEAARGGLGGGGRGRNSNDEALRNELNGMRQQLQQAQAQEGRVKDLAAQLAEVEADRQHLRRQLEQIQDNLKRTMTEKAFIEDRFMQLDADRPVAEPAAEAMA